MTYCIGFKIIEEEKMYFMIFFIIYIHLIGQKLPTSERTDATSNARLLVQFVKPSKKDFISKLSKTHFRY